MSRLLTDLDPRVYSAAVLLEGEAEFIGFDLLIYCTRRDLAEQARLFRRGRTLAEIQQRADDLCDIWERPDLAALLMEVGPQPGKLIRTNAAPGQSLHNYGLAFDAVPMRDGKPVWGAEDPDDLAMWAEYGKLARHVGLDWAGDWKIFKEFPHAQLPDVRWQDLIKGAA